MRRASLPYATPPSKEIGRGIRGSSVAARERPEKGSRGPVRGRTVPIRACKTRITIRLDDDVIEWFKAQVESAGGGNYQSLINLALREHMKRVDEPLERTPRRVLREELRRG